MLKGSVVGQGQWRTDLLQQELHSITLQSPAVEGLLWTASQTPEKRDPLSLLRPVL